MSLLLDKLCNGWQQLGVTQSESNLRSLDFKSDALPMCHHVTQIITCRVVQKKLHKVSCTVILHSSATKSCSLHQNDQKLNGNTKKDRIWILWLNISYTAACKSENVNTGNTFNAVMAEEKFATRKHHWTNENDAQYVHHENEWPTTVV